MAQEETILSDPTKTPTTEEPTFAPTIGEKPFPPRVPENIPPGELVLSEDVKAKEQEIEALKAQITQQEDIEGARVKELEGEQAKAAARIAELEAKQRDAERMAYLARVGGAILKDENGISYQVSPAYLETVEKVLMQVPPTTIVQTATGPAPLSTVLEGVFENLINLSKDGGMLNTMTELDRGTYPTPTGSDVSRLEQAKTLAKEKGISYREALLQVSEDESKK